MGKRLSYFLILLALLASNGSFAYSPKIDNHLIDTLERAGFTNVIVSMKQGTRDILSDLAQVSFASRTERSQAVYDALTARARNSQSRTLNWLAEPTISKTFKYGKIHSLWITNQIAIEVASREFINVLASMEDISKIQEDGTMELIHPVESQSSNESSVKAVVHQWGVARLQAPKAWDEGTRGAGVVVASIDTGVRLSHEILRTNYGYYENDTHAWYDPYNESNEAHDRHGHGTHTVGTMVGTNGFGVAPAARWIACKGLDDDGYGTRTALTRCGQFLVCPTNYDGADADCSKTPHVVGNSWVWGGGSEDPFFDDVIAAWHAAGIVPVFGAGNDGPRCRTIFSPADRDVIAVGSTTIDDTKSSFSSVGPSYFNTMKPDVSAPGSTVMSADHRNDNTYSVMSGTSMATPHVVGAVALLLSKNPYLTYVQIKQLLQSYADRDLRFDGSTCNYIKDDAFPNHHFGYGLVNVHRSLKALN